MAVNKVPEPDVNPAIERISIPCINHPTKTCLKEGFLRDFFTPFVSFVPYGRCRKSVGASALPFCRGTICELVLFFVDHRTWPQSRALSDRVLSGRR